MFETLFKIVSTPFGLRIVENSIENPHFIFCSSFQNLRLGSIKCLFKCLCKTGDLRDFYSCVMCRVLISVPLSRDCNDGVTTRFSFTCLLASGADEVHSQFNCRRRSTHRGRRGPPLSTSSPRSGARGSCATSERARSARSTHPGSYGRLKTTTTSARSAPFQTVSSAPRSFFPKRTRWPRCRGLSAVWDIDASEDKDTNLKPLIIQIQRDIRNSAEHKCYRRSNRGIQKTRHSIICVKLKHCVLG
jgi:hypothetical protein